jgi:hypothetical protein
MPVLFQKIIYREDLRRNQGNDARQDVLYVFGDNVLRRGMGGQAGHMRGERNAVGVATKYRPSMDPEDFFGDEPAQIEAQNHILDQDMKILFDKVKAGGIVVWPTDGIGTGLSEMPTRAPATWDYLQQKLIALLKTAKMYDKGNQA